jgi:hypothetical protein
MPEHAFADIMIGTVAILCLAVALRTVFSVRGRIGAVSCVAASAIILAVLANSGLASAWVSVQLAEELSQNLWMPAVMFGTAVLVAAVA